MNLNKQQLGAVANKIFNQLEEARLAKIEELKPSILSDPTYVELLSKKLEYEEINNLLGEVSREITNLKKSLKLEGCYNHQIESRYLELNLNLKQVKIEDIKNELILASIEQDNLTELIETVTTKFNQ